MKPLFNFKKKEEKPKKQPKAKVKKPAVEKEPQYYRSKTNIQTLNYKVYYMTKKEMILYTLLGLVVGGLADRNNTINSSFYYSSSDTISFIFLTIQRKRYNLILKAKLEYGYI